MRKLINRVKSSIKGVCWPAPKEVVADTILTVLTTAVLSIMISGWTHAIEYIVDWVVSIF